MTRSPVLPMPRPRLSARAHHLGGRLVWARFPVRALVAVLLLGLPVADGTFLHLTPAHADPAAGPGAFSQTTTGAVTAGSVPDGTCRAKITGLGGGGASSSAGGTGGQGAAAAQVVATFAVLPGQSYSGSVAGGGQNPAGGVGGGGAGGTVVTNHRGGGGGGRTVASVGGVTVLVAGGGGGGGAAHQNSPNGAGGAAGTAVAAGVPGPGTSGTNGVDTAGVTAGGGQGGQALAGGNGGVNSGSAALNGAAGGAVATGAGGNGGPDPSYDSGGGGGAGYTGAGGGSATTVDSVTGGGGGGGSSWVAATSPTVGAPVPSGITGSAGTTTATGTVAGANGQLDIDWLPCQYDLALTKTASPSPVKAGGKITWTVAVTNNGPDPMTKGDTLDLADTLPAGPNGAPAPAYKVVSLAMSGGTNADLSRGAITCSGVSVGSSMPAATNCSRTYSAPSAPGAPAGGVRGLDVSERLTIVYEQIIANTAPCATITNTATVKDRPTVTGTTDITGVTTTDTVATPVVVQCYDLAITKVASPKPQVVRGDPITWTITVTNNGPADMEGPADTTANPLVVTDTFPSSGVGAATLTSSTGPAGSCALAASTVTCPGSLKNGEQQVLVFSQTVNVGTSAGTVIANTASVTDPKTGDANDSATDQTTVATFGLTISKTSPTASFAAAGDVVNYTITVTNTGSAALANATVVDPNAVLGTCTPAIPVASLAGGATISCPASHTVVAGDLNSAYTNTATVNATKPGGTVMTASSTVSTPLAKLTVVKTSSAASFAAVNDVLNYTITVTNSGTTAVTNATVTDANAVLGTCTPAVPVASLAVGATISCPATHTVVAADLAGSYTNTASASATRPGGGTVGSSGSVTTPVAKLTLVKTSSTSSFAAVGDPINYTVVVTNAGTATLTNVGVNDANAVVGTCTPALPVASLAPGATISCPATHTVVAADLAGSYTNTADTFATAPNGTTTTASGSATTPVAKLSITKTTSNPTFVAVGDVLNYTITVTNPGTASLSNVSVTDANAVLGTCTPALPVASLPPGGTITCPATHTVVAADLAGSYTNTASASATAPGGATTTASANVTTPVSKLSVTKASSTASFRQTGDVISYTITVANPGTATLTNVTVSDPNATLGTCTPSVPVASLAPGASISCPATHTVAAADLSGSYTNTATASATKLDGGSIAALGAVTTPLAKLAVTKAATEASFGAAGDVLHYTITVTNNGTAPLTGISLSDPNAVLGPCTPAVPVASFAPGATISCPATHTVVGADLAGSYTNTATATGTSPAGPAVSASGVATTPVAKLVVAKTATESSFVAAGDVLHYTIAVTNTGTATLTNVGVTDPNAAVSSCSPAVPVASLAAGATISCTATHTVTAGDLAGSYTNVATASGTSPAGTTVTGSGTVTTPVARLATTKSAAEASFQAAGDVLNYTITATNIGTAPLTSVSVTDPAATLGSCTPAVPVASLAPGAVISCPATHTVTAGDLAGSYINTANASGTGPGGTTATSAASTTTPVAKIAISKTSSTASFSAAGDIVSYSIVVTNTGTATLTNVGVTDALASLGTCTPSAPATLTPGATITCSASHTVTAADLAGSYTNAASTTGTAPSGSTVTATSSVTVPVARIAVVKTSPQRSYTAIGDVITYGIVTTNTGTAPLTNVTVSDPNAVLGSCSPSVPVASLAPGASISCPASHSATAADVTGGNIVNTATASGSTPAGATVSAQSTETTLLGRLDVTKTAGTSSFSAAGDVITYTIAVTNSGTAPLSNVAVSDPNAQLGSCSPPVPVGLLGPGSTIVCSASHTVVAGDVGSSYTNVATASGSAPGGVAVTGSGSATTPYSALRVVKTSSTASFKAVGDVLTYSIVVTNAGSSPLTNVVLTDAQATVGSCTPSLPAASLAAGATVSCSASHTVVAADLGASYVNTATVTARDVGGATLSASDSATVPYASATLSKTTATTSSQAAGDVIQYTLVATNTGTATLTNASITETNANIVSCSPALPLASFAPGQTITCTASHTVLLSEQNAGIVTNTATVNAKAPGGATVSASDTAQTPAAIDPHLDVTKSAAVGTYDSPGDVIGYTITVVNSGNVSIFNTTVTDANAVLGSCSPSSPVALLLPGDTITCSATHTLTQADVDAGSVPNTATATGTPAGGGTVTGSGSTVTSVLRQPDLRLTKTANVTSVSGAGATITYTITATNTGNVTLSSVSVADANATIGSCSPSAPVATLSPGASIVCPASHVVTQADVDAGSIVNVATAVATAPGGASVNRSANVTTTAVRNPELTTTKTASTTTYDTVGQVVAFSVTATNTGNVTLSNVGVTDANATLGSCTPTIPAATLAPGAAITCPAIHTVTQADLDAGTVQNTAVASGTSPTGSTVSDASPAVFVPATQRPELTAAKSTTATSYSAVGQVASYTIGVTNTGNVTISVVSLFDAGASLGACTPPLPVAALSPGASVSCAATHTVTQDDLDAGHLDNVVHATGLDPFGSSVVDDSPVVTTPAVQTPALDTTKSTATTSVSTVGQTVTYTVTTTNVGNVTLTSATITDSNATLGSCSPAVPVARFAPGATITCSATHTTTQADLDAGRVDNVATGTARDPNNAVVSDPSPLVSVPAVQSPSLAATKSSSTVSYTAVGNVITYQVTVTNTGNVTLANVAVADAAASLGSCTPSSPAPTVAPGASISCSATHTVTLADLNANQYDNTASASGTAPGGAPVNATSNTVVVPATQGPSLTTTKSSPTTSYANIGDVITYDIVATNSGNVTLSNVLVADAAAVISSCSPVAPVASLAPGASVSCAASHTVTQADVDAGHYDNVASAAGTAPTGDPVAGDSLPVVVPAVRTPQLTTTKSSPTASYSAVGDVITYTVVATNSGNVTLTNVAVTDASAALGSCSPASPVASLAPGASISCPASHTVTQADIDAGHYDNVASASGRNPAGGATSDDSPTVSVPAVQSPQLTTTKSSPTTSYNAVGNVIAYSILVTNSGNVTLTNVAVTDAAAALGSCSPASPVASLAPGASISCPATHTVTQADLNAGHYDNVASGSGRNPAGGATSDDSPTVSVPAVQSPQLTTTKSSPTTSYNAVGNVIAYSILVTNTGNVTLTNVSVTDANATLGSCSPALPVASLVPGATISCPASHTVTQADIDAGHYDNIASASATNPAGGTTSAASPTVSVPAVQNPRLTTTKSSPTTSYNAVGNTVAYGVVVTNSGNVTLTNVSVTDANATLGSCSPALPVASLVPGATISCPASHTVTQADIDAGHYDNVASASGTNPAGGTTSAASSTVSVPAVQSPGIGISKSSPTSSYSAVNDPINYVITIVNTGNVTLSNIGVVDPNASFGSCAPSFPIISLAPGDAVTCLASHRATQADIDAGHYDNVASTSARTPAGATLTGSTPAVVVPATQTPSLRAAKTAVTSSFTAVGDVVTFSIHVVNDGNVTLSGVTVTDPSATLGSCTPGVPVASLAPNTAIDCSASRAATQADLDAGRVDNVARASGTSPSATPVVADTPLATVPAVQNAALATTKSTSTASYARAGDTITYTVTARNTGNVTLTNVAVADGAATLGMCTPAQPVATLAPGGTISCPATRTIVQADVDAGHYDNVATSGATTPGGATVTAASPVVTVNANRGASLAVAKTATAPSYTAVGDVASYSIVVRNSGNLTLSNVSVADAAATLGACTPSIPVASLAPGATITCAASHTVTQADLDAGRHDNVATASGTDPFGAGVSTSSAVASVPATQRPQLTTTKTTSTTSYAEVGDPIVYAITVRNTGNVTLTAAAVNDPGAVLALCSPTLPVATLAPGAAITCLARHLATQADLDSGHYDNVATGTATDPGGAAVSGPSPAVRAPAARAPHLTVAKSSSTSAYGSVGATIGYTINVVNDGNVALTGVDVVDPGAVVTGCTPATPVATLARYATVTCNAARTVTQGDLDAGHYDNVAGATGTDSGGTPATGTSPVVRVPADQSPHLVVTKTTSTPSYGFIGAPIDYTISVLNDGNVTIAGVVVDDPNATLGNCTPALPASIGSGATLVCPARHLATQADLDRGFVDNAASVAGTDPGGATVAAASALVTVTARIGPELTVNKMSTVTAVAAVGDVVPYTITVQNTGNVALSPVKIVDENATFGSCAPALPITTLASGAIVTCAATHTVTQADIDAGKVVNVAKATGTVPGAPPVSDDSPAVETPVRQLPNLVLAKTASLKDDNGNGTGNVGETVSYVLTARNGGNVTLRGVAVVDAMFPNLACDRPQPTDLAPGASYACRGSHVIVAGDVVNGKVLNTATASGNSECSPGVVCSATVSDHAEAAVDAAPAALPRTGANVLRQLTLAAALSVLGLLVLLAPLGRRRRGDDDAPV